ncbi:MAG TPA: GNAT family N-acetyltransferase [Bryobacteraceae bacterium]|nr:GNAT family N-acetyltransferase [Bryobacteraceae bacterium]
MPADDGRPARLRPMTPRDIDAGLRLCRLSNWNQVEDDWRCFLNSPAGGGWLAESNGIALGSVAYLRYGASFTWLSMMLVDPQARRTGIGSRLLEAALEAFANDSCVRLDATPAGEPLYRGYGFVPESELVRCRLTAVPPGLARGTARPLESGDLPQILANDREVFGADRSDLLASFRSRAPEFAWISQSSYCFGRTGHRDAQIGPIVSESLSAACDLVVQCLLNQRGRTVILDVPRIPEWLGWLESAGFTVERPFLRMRRGENRHPGQPHRQFAIAGPEFG